jgi:adenylyltransferase/sulfurtransferase
VLDCTDHPTSRYLISDACVLTGKPLVSASALKTEGQLIVLNNPPKPPEELSGGPCYRCIFPKPPPAESVLSCGEGGILGPVVGIMGVLQALEAIKVLTKQDKTANTNPSTTKGVEEPPRASLLMFSAYSNPQFRTMRLRSRRDTCAACSAERTISADSLTSGSLDYIAFCGRTAPVNVRRTMLVFHTTPRGFSSTCATRFSTLCVHWTALSTSRGLVTPNPG